jgi:hypothetical protein
MLMLLVCQTVHASENFLEHTTLTHRAHYRVEYTGFLGALFDEYVRFISGVWEDSIWEYSGDGFNERIDLRLERINRFKAAYEDASWSDCRTRWWHFTEEWGEVKTYQLGPKNDIINLGPIKITNKFKLKVKHYELTIAPMLSIKVRPRFRFHSKVPFLKRVSVGLEFVHHNNSYNLLVVSLRAGVEISSGDGVFELLVELPGW